jgi:hypothetical protein
MLHLSFLPASIFLLSVPFVFCLPSIRLPCLCLFIVALAQVSEYCTLDLPLQTLGSLMGSGRCSNLSFGSLVLLFVSLSLLLW